MESINEVYNYRIKEFAKTLSKEMRVILFSRWPSYIAAIRQDPCAYCGRFGWNTLDHIVPKNDNGDDGWHNLTAACDKCNRIRAHTPLLDWLLDKNRPGKLFKGVNCDNS